MPTSCCVVDCSNKHTGRSSLKFYRIPRGKTPFERKRRQAWIRAINRKDWDTWSEERISKQRVCGAHFLSGKTYSSF